VLDRVITSGLPRTTETAAIVAAGREIEAWPELRELEGDRLSSIPPSELEIAFVHAFRGVVPNEKRFLNGESIGELFDRVLPALERLLSDREWDTALLVLHGAVNRAILSYALTGQRMFLGRFEQAAGCLNVLDVGDEWIVRAVNVSPPRPRPPRDARDDDGGLLGELQGPGVRGGPAGGAGPPLRPTCPSWSRSSRRRARTYSCP
jgi:probable phosphoglycerate mutase